MQTEINGSPDYVRDMAEMTRFIRSSNPLPMHVSPKATASPFSGYNKPSFRLQRPPFQTSESSFSGHCSKTSSRKPVKLV
ncbi:hypothetical protein [uncultured Bacteroides sp.]|uniref:hypothetical protein n=1 Tax=uncultured Bacteroides sp. TaxID=162156 RepID=UPI0026388B37|nr:hypothetical protein [uncultured Bacteroides sp.]